MGRWLKANGIDPVSNKYLEEDYKQSEERHEADGYGKDAKRPVQKLHGLCRENGRFE